MNDQEIAVGAGVGLAVYLAVILISLVFYVFFCYCCKLICEKAGHDPGVLIWIPIANFVPLLTIAKLPIWFIILLLIPCVSFIAVIVLWWKICEVRGKPGALALLLLVPVANIILIPYLAFSE